ncbi:MAG: UDP-N-acetylmuramoyl-tripeptide--D-alanyl-D-alanine ligase, partial [Candidatus Kryptoniota bacterium]
MITIQDLNQIPNIEIYNLKFRQAKSVSTDSRSVVRGQIFFALKGERFDGHDFVLEAIRKGAVCAVVNRQWLNENKQAKEKFPLAVVDDTTVALGKLALIYRKKFDIPVIAVGGSNGKTTVKEMIARVLSAGLKVLKTEGNHNNQIGVPLTLFNLKPSHDVAVIEIGTNHPGEMESLCKILEPTAGLLTNIGKEHLEFFKNIKGVKKEEGVLFEYLSRNAGTAFVNGDDINVFELSKSVKERHIYGFTNRVGVRKHVSGMLFGFDAKGCGVFEIKHKSEVELIHLKVSGIHNVSNALAAA